MPEVELLLTGFSVTTDQGGLGLSTVVLIRGRGNTLVDVAHFGRRQHLAQALEKAGLKPADIDTLILTHSHWDHCCNIDLFPNARIVVHPDEVAYSRSPNPDDWATPHDFDHTLEGRPIVDAREGLELEPGVKIVETPGHSKGHISVLVETRQGTVAVAGDALSDAGALSRGLPYLVFWNEEQARVSVRRIADSAPRIYPGHDRPFLHKDGGAVEYLVPPTAIRVTALLEAAGSNLGITLALDPPRVSVVQPSARRGATRR